MCWALQLQLQVNEMSYTENVFSFNFMLKYESLTQKEGVFLKNYRVKVVIYHNVN